MSSNMKQKNIAAMNYLKKQAEGRKKKAFLPRKTSGGSASNPIRTSPPSCDNSSGSSRDSVINEAITIVSSEPAPAPETNSNRRRRGSLVRRGSAVSAAAEKEMLLDSSDRLSVLMQSFNSAEFLNDLSSSDESDIEED